MARIEWVAQRLENWALWHERKRAGGLGYATQAIFADGPAARGQVEGPRIPVLELEAAITDEAVEHLKLGDGHLYQTLRLYYLRGLGVKETARTMRRAESTIHEQLGRADRKLADWFNDRPRVDRWRARAGDPDSVRAVAAEVTVQRLNDDEIRALKAWLAIEREQLEARRRPALVGPPRPPVKRARPKLTRRGFTP